jgi:hypothetical protein
MNAVSYTHSYSDPGVSFFEPFVKGFQPDRREMLADIPYRQESSETLARWTGDRFSMMLLENVGHHGLAPMTLRITAA